MEKKKERRKKGNWNEKNGKEIRDQTRWDKNARTGLDW